VTDTYRLGRAVRGPVVHQDHAWPLREIEEAADRRQSLLPAVPGDDDDTDPTIRHG
jgi:hypothetical protein